MNLKFQKIENHYSSNDYIECKGIFEHLEHHKQISRPQENVLKVYITELRKARKGRRKKRQTAWWLDAITELCYSSTLCDHSNSNETRPPMITSKQLGPN
jgi:hypothetical protein